MLRIRDTILWVEFYNVEGEFGSEPEREDGLGDQKGNL